MAQEQNISTQLDNLLVTRNFSPEMLDRQGKPSDSGEAKTFTFDYVSNSGKNYGTMVVILDSENDMKVFYGDNLGRAMEGDDKDEFFDFQQHLSKFARMHRWTYTAKDLNQLKHTMQGLAAIQEGLFEGYYGTRRISYAGEPTEARLMIKHNRVLGEADARFRYVESLFIETADNQRFKLAFKNLAGGRAMLEHVRQGGNPYDVRGVHISEMVMEIATLSRFNRASASRMLEGTTKELVTEAQTYYKSLRENMKRMASPRGYNAYFETWHPATIDEQQDLVEDIKTLFIEQTLDTRIEAALPLLARIQQQGNAMKEAQIFENWINNMSEGTWSLPETPEQLNRLKELMATELIVGPDATNATEQLYDLIGDDELFDRLGDLAERDPRANAWNDTEVMNRLAELGIEMPEPSVPGNPAEPATAPVPPVAAAPAVPAAPVAEGKWDPFTGGDYGQTPRPQQVGQDSQDSQDSDIAAPDKEKDQAEWEAMLDYYGTNALVQRALGDLYKQTHGSGYHDSVVTPERYLAIIEKTLGGRTTTEKKYFPNKQAAHKYAKSSFGHVVSFEKIDNKEDTADLITLPVMLGLGQQKKKWMLQFPDEAYAQKWAFKHKNVATILWPEGHNLEKDVTEGMGRGVDAKGRTQAQWIQLVKAKFPDGKMIQAKMPDGPVQVTLPDGRKLGWKKVEQAVAEGQDATTYTVAYKDSQKPGKSYSTQVKATSAAEAKAAFQEWDTTNRFTYLGSRPDVDTVYEGDGNPDIRPGMKVSQGTVVKVDGNTVTVKTSNGDMTMNIHDIDQAVAESAELNTMLKYAGIPVTEGVLTDSTGGTLDHICDRFGKEVRDFETSGEMSDDLFHALYDYYFDDMPYGTKKGRDGDPYEWVSDRFAQDRGIDESNSGMIMPEADPISSLAVGAADPKKTEKFTNQVAGAGALGVGLGILEGSCNMTTEGEYCPEHGLMECGVYEMGTVAGGMAPVVGEGKQDPLVRLKSLALIK